jgi:hypothetical protein
MPLSVVFMTFVIYLFMTYIMYIVKWREQDPIGESPARAGGGTRVVGPDGTMNENL